MSTTIDPITLAKYMKLEEERSNTMVSDGFIKWMHEFNVGVIAEDNTRKISANLLMNQYTKYPKFIKNLK